MTVYEATAADRRTAMHPQVRVIHRHPNPPMGSSDRAAPRLVDLDPFMAIEPSAIERAFFGFLFEEPPPFEDVDGVAVVSIDGPLMQRGGWFYDGYQAIQKRFSAALNDRKTDAVLLKINSPGGVGAGCFSAARAMQSAKEASGKPVLAYADESAYSAAYAMASIADEVYLPKEGGVGSVGVIGVLEDWSAFNEQMGIKVAVITSGAEKADGHPDVPLSKEVLDRYQLRINSLARSFAEVVGASREMTPEDVLALQAACLYGQEAVRGGLADGVATLEETIAKARKMGAKAARETERSARAVRTFQVRRYV